MKIYEILDYNIPNLQWFKQGNQEFCTFSVDEKIFRLVLTLIDSVDYVTFEGSVKIVDVSFYRVDVHDDERAYSSYQQNSPSSTIYGVIYNALRNKIHEYDAFHFYAYRKHSNDEKEYLIKSKVYRIIAKRIEKEFPITLYEFSSGFSNNFLLSKKPIKSKHYKNDLQENIKFLNSLNIEPQKFTRKSNNQ